MRFKYWQFAGEQEEMVMAIKCRACGLGQRFRQRRFGKKNKKKKKKKQ